jgi:hypothetical protein
VLTAVTACGGGASTASGTPVAATAVVVAPPAAATGENGRTDSCVEFDLTSVQVGTLQPSSQGVLVL